MSKREKLLEKWRKNAPTEEHKEKVFSILLYYGFSKVGGIGSHEVWYHPKLLRVSHEDVNQLGEITIAVKGGQKVKKHYLKVVADVIEMITT